MNRSRALYPAPVGRPVATLAVALACAGALLPAASAQVDQTWFELSGGGVSASDHWGRSAALLPDVNSDGHADMLIGAPQDGGVGSAYVYSGKAPHLPLKLLHGESTSSTFGQVVAHAGLVDGDAVPDFLVSAPREEVVFGMFQLMTDAGRVTLYSGATGAVLRTFTGTKTGARFGDSIASNADCTGDGVPDVLIGAPHWDKTDATDNEGYVSLYNGANGMLLHRHEGTEDGELLGWSVAFLGDLTGDGRSEYAIGAPGKDWFEMFPVVHDTPDAGRVTVHNGATHAPLYSKYGLEKQQLGMAVSGVGDSNGDGVRELLVGAPGVGALGVSTGRALLCQGNTGLIVRIYDGDVAGEHFGSWLCKAGDLNKDGFMEVAIGGTEADVSSGGGFVRVFDGGAEGQLKTFDYATGSGAGGHAAFDGGQDVNDDGWPDLLVGLPNIDGTGTDSGGAVCIGQLHYQPSLGFQGPHLATFTIKGGKLASGNKADFELIGAPWGGTPFLMLSPGIGFTPFKGGTLVPKFAGSVMISFPPLPTGTMTLPGIPGGGGPVNVYAQFIVTGYAGSEPIGLSNALVIQLEP
jgi:hypothetical protein